VVLYVNIARLLVQGIIPFICLSFLNYRIYWVMKRRRQLINRPQPRAASTNGAHSQHQLSSQQKKANEAQQAVVLFVIVLLFFLCHTPRFVLNIHELLTLDTLISAIEDDCNSVSVWALSCASVSHCLMTLNSSVNFFIYAFTSSTFREVFCKHVVRLTPNLIKIWWSRCRCRKAEAGIEVVQLPVSPTIGITTKGCDKSSVGDAVTNVDAITHNEEQNTLMEERPNHKQEDLSVE
jgi:hypothetical protein